MIRFELLSHNSPSYCLLSSYIAEELSIMNINEIKTINLVDVIVSNVERTLNFIYEEIILHYRLLPIFLKTKLIITYAFPPTATL